MDQHSSFAYLYAHEEYFIKHGQRIEFRKNQFFVRPDDPVPWVFFLQKGLIKISFSLKNGDERIIGYIVPGMTFAQNRTFFEADGGGLEYSTVQPSIAYRIDRKEFLKQVKSNAAFNSDYLQSLLRNQIYLIDRIVYQGENNIHRKSLRWLLFMAKYYGTQEGRTCRINVPLTQDVIGNFLHASRESVSKQLSELSSQRIISISKKYITIHDFNAIESQLE